MLRFEQARIGDVGPLDLDIQAGEIVGLVGLRGAGHEAVGKCLFGLLPVDEGSIRLRGEPTISTAPPAAIRRGICFVAGDRTANSIAHGLTVRENMFLNPLASGRGASRLAWRRATRTRRRCGSGSGWTFSPNSPEAPIETLSGGNQQKVVMARWMRVGGSVLILEDPTAGVDVAAKAEIYRLLADAVTSGQAVILISTDFEEVAAICHRALVFRDGLIVAELDQESLSVERLVHTASLAAPAAAAGQSAPQGRGRGCSH